MGEAIGAVLPMGVGVALSPLPIVAVVLMLSGTRGGANGPAFLLGWLLGLAVVGTVALLLAATLDPSDDDDPAAWVSWLKLALGVVVLMLAVRTWRSRPVSDDGGEPALPSWLTALDSWTAAKAFGLGAALSAANPKNLVLTLAASAAIAQTGASAASQAVALAVFVVVGALGPGLPVAIDLVMGDRAERLLADLETWLARHNAAVLVVVLLVIGAKLIGDGVAGLSA